MAFSIRNSRVEEKARSYAAQQGTTLTGALELALDKALHVPERRPFDDPEREAAFQEWYRPIREASERIGALPDTGPTEQDIMGWDENGLPT